MQLYEYKVVPAPRRGEKARGVKSTEERFALTLTMLMNDLARDGWDYVRADALPCDERVGLTGSKTTFQNMLVFRRSLGAAAPAEPVSSPLVAIPFLRADPDDTGAPVRLGTPEAREGKAPALGPAKSDLAAE
ncbi:DUF4177 domain-containing protein [Rhodobacter sp. Har01]|uniref:DUF4177 domain-containing protein n=1 Tax=Rhodobacter sp. Har01 TaxID=2883999 RepID=UPI001D092B72|nr:DUF4177 domain-containing protein [Rhodobacter sp. Har01]MCB6176519.1 DUF4177 domain-containing protein [Rhodobacter sp. Har01]